MWTTLLFSARQVRRSTPHFWLAAVSSISRAVAPAVRNGFHVPTLLPLPLVRKRMP
jgi:hypothetical protein